MDGFIVNWLLELHLLDADDNQWCFVSGYGLVCCPESNIVASNKVPITSRLINLLWLQRCMDHIQTVYPTGHAGMGDNQTPIPSRSRDISLIDNSRASGVVLRFSGASDYTESYGLRSQRRHHRCQNEALVWCRRVRMRDAGEDYQASRSVVIQDEVEPRAAEASLHFTLSVRLHSVGLLLLLLLLLWRFVKLNINKGEDKNAYGNMEIVNTAVF